MPTSFVFVDYENDKRVFIRLENKMNVLYIGAILANKLLIAM